MKQEQFSTTVGDQTISFTLSDVAPQAGAAVIGTHGETSVLATVVMGKEDRDTDFFPLTVDYEERFYAAGKILGSRFVRREGRPSQDAVLSGRLIDRTIRPLFNDALRRDVQVIITILSYDEKNDPDIIALLSTSLALGLSEIPWNGPVAGVRVLFDPETEQISYNKPTQEVEAVMQKTGGGEILFAGTDEKVNMIELEGNEIQETTLENMFVGAQDILKKLVSFQNDIIAKHGKEKATVSGVVFDEKLVADIRNQGEAMFTEAVLQKGKQERDDALSSAMKQLRETLLETSYTEEDLAHFHLICDDVINEIVHKKALNEGIRVDGRGMDEIRPLESAVGIIPRVHGSSLFTRGLTHALAVTTLAPPGAHQLVETIEATSKKRFLLHYNFPPYSVGETGRMGSPGRREIGHGALAQKALQAVIPSQEVFPYTIRLVSEIVSSNGSSSMATVCAGSLSLMDAGVPIKKPVAGIALGVMTHQGYDPKATEKDYVILTDIQGPEDHYGDMDFKVAGTTDGITAMQMDVKIEGITKDIFVQALSKAKEARMKILQHITSVIAAPRERISQYAPVIKITSILPEQIGLVIGPGGKTINGLIEKYDIESIDIDDDGKVFISGTNIEDVEKVLKEIEGMTHVFHVGDIVEGDVIKTLDFGAIVDLGGGRDGMIHVSELKDGYVKQVEDILKVGDHVQAKVIKVDESSGKISLSIKALGK